MAYITNKGHLEGVDQHLSSTLDVDEKVTENSDEEMTNGTLTIDKGNEFINSGSLDVSQNGNENGGTIFAQTSMTVGRNIKGETGTGGNLIVRGNGYFTGVIKFDYGLSDGTGSPDGSGGFTGGGSNCAEGSTGSGFY